MYNGIARNLKVENLKAQATLEIYPIGSEKQNLPYGITIIINDPSDVLPYSVYMLISDQAAGIFCYINTTTTISELVAIGFEPEIISYEKSDWQGKG